LAILVSAEMLISFIADSEMLWAGGAACLPADPSAGRPAAASAAGAGDGAAACAFSDGWPFSAG
jgi:hypothetical protein